MQLSLTDALIICMFVVRWDRLIRLGNPCIKALVLLLLRPKQFIETEKFIDLRIYLLMSVC